MENSHISLVAVPEALCQGGDSHTHLLERKEVLANHSRIILVCPRILLATSLWSATPVTGAVHADGMLLAPSVFRSLSAGGSRSSELIVPSSRDPARQVLQMLLHLWKGHLSVGDSMASLSFHEITGDS